MLISAAALAALPLVCIFLLSLRCLWVGKRRGVPLRGPRREATRDLDFVTSRDASPTTVDAFTVAPADVLNGRASPSSFQTRRASTLWPLVALSR